MTTAAHDERSVLESLAGLLRHEMHVVSQQPAELVSHLYNMSLMRQSSGQALAGLRGRMAQALDDRIWLALDERPDLPPAWEAVQGVFVHGTPVYSLACWRSSAGDGWLATGSNDGSLCFWDLSSGGLVTRSAAHSRGISGLRAAPDGATVVASSVDGRVTTWDPWTGATLDVRDLGGPCNAVALGADRRIAAALETGAIAWWQGDGPVREIEAHHGGVNVVVFVDEPAGARLASGGDDGVVATWDLDAGALLKKREVHEGPVTAAGLLEAGPLLLTAGADRTLRLWEPDMMMVVATVEGVGAVIEALAIQPHGSIAAWNGQRGRLFLWDAASTDGQSASTLRSGHHWPIFSVCWTPDGEAIATGSADGTARLLDAGAREGYQPSRGHETDVAFAAISPDCSVVVSGESGTTSETLYTLGMMMPDSSNIRGMPAAGAPLEPSRLALPEEPCPLMQWAPHPFETPLVRYEGHTGSVGRVAWSPSGSLIASVGRQDECVRVWRAEGGPAVREMRHGIPLSPVAWLGEDRLVAGDYEGNLCAFGVESGSPLWAVIRHSGRISAVAVRSEEPAIASGGIDDDVCLTCSDGTREIGHLMHWAHVYGLAWSPDGERLATGCRDGTLRLWRDRAHTIDGMTMEWEVWNAHAGEIDAIAWSPDGALIASGAADGAVKLWRADDGELVASARCLSWVYDLRFRDAATLFAVDDGCGWVDRPVQYTYDVRRPGEAATRACGHCGAAVPLGGAWCPGCGRDM